MRYPTTYSLGGYGAMMAPSPRIDGYAQALRRAVRPGSIVLDIGAGTGIFSLLACQYGASHVHAVEPDDVITMAHSFAADNGFAGRITFHQTLSTRLALPVRADVVVSDLRGTTPLFQQHLPAIIDARQRLLAEGGVMIPMRDTLYGAMIESPRLYAPYQEPWLRNQFDLDLSAAQPIAVNAWRKVRVAPDELLTRPQAWARLDYRTIQSADVAGEVAWTADRSGTAHGLAVWFDAELADGVGFSNAPGRPPLDYGQAFFPLQSEVAIEAGDRVTVALNAHLVGDDYVISWRTTITSVSGGQKASFQQSTFHGEVVSLASIKRTADHFVPATSEELQIDRHCLDMADGRACLGDIARSLAQEFPHRFPDQSTALAYAAGLFERYAPQTAGASGRGWR